MPAPHYTVSSISGIIQAEGNITFDSTITTLLTDSRRISNAPEALFFALSAQRNGHYFIDEAYQAGVRNFVVTDMPGNPLPNANYLVVENVLAALQQLAAFHRAQFNLQVIGVTGSNGKTIVKEWLYQLLAVDKNIVRSPKSYNSQIGVPLSVWKINQDNNLGIFEAGISTTNEMTALEQIIKPDIGILTHIGPAHDEGFANPEEKIAEKLKLFEHCQLLIANYEMVNQHVKSVKAKQFTWSRQFNQADLFVFSETIIAQNYYLRAQYQGNEIEGNIPFLDQASVENAITCWATMLALGYSAEEADKRLEHLVPVSMRLEMKNGINDCSVIDDSYNSDVQSLEIALNFLDQQNQHQKKTLILSDILQSGLSEDQLYTQVAQMVADDRIDRFIGVGEALNRHRNLFKVNALNFYTDTKQLLDHFSFLNFSDETILIKGARSFEFERISRALVQKAHETIMEINLNALLHNLSHYKSKLHPGVKMMAMVKAFSYGSGTFEVANILQYHKIDYLAVAYIDEGVALRQAGITLPIMVLNPEASAFDKLVEHKLEPEIYSFNLLDDFLAYVTQSEISDYSVHIKIDTGMHRLGFELTDLDALCEVLEATTHVKVQSVFSHLVASDAEVHDTFTLKQIRDFEKACEQLSEALGYKFLRHIVNTSGITRWPIAQFDMVRLGIGLYGIDAAVTDATVLQPIATLKTSISQIKSIKAGETVGYNRNGSLPKDGRIATVRIGYADGYLRSFGNGVGKMLVNGKLVQTVGNIAMDMCMIDVSEVEVQEGDEVIIFDQTQRIEEVARQIGTIPYEILTNISQRVKRVYYYE